MPHLHGPRSDAAYTRCFETPEFSLLYLGVDMEAQKCLRNSGFLPPLAADGVYDHDCAVPSTVRHAGRAQERPAREVSASLLSKKNVPIQGLLTWLSLLAFGCS